MIDRLGSMDALRSTMRKWTPQQLQQFAMQNQDNIIAMSLISQEQRDRDEARQAQAGQQPQQPKVVEQVISELNQQAQQMPEDVGIGQLPARNLEGMADGGIVGYADGGEVSMAVGGGVAFARWLESIGSSASEFINESKETQKFLQEEFSKTTQGPKSIPTPQAAPQAATQASRFAAASVPTAVGGIGALLSAGSANALRNATPEQREQLSADIGSDTGFAAAIMNAAKHAPEEPSLASPRPAPRYIPTTPGVVPEVAPRTQGQAAPDMGAMPAAQPRTTTQQPPAQSGMAGLMEQYKKAQEMVGGDGKDPYAAQREEIMKNRQEQARREEAGIEEREKGLGSLMKSREERIAAREGKIGEQERTDQNMAIIRAGLALATSTKKGFGAALAEGATAGMNDLLKSKALTKAERQKVEDARDAMDEFKFNQGELTRKEKIAAQNKIEEVKNIAAEQSIQALIAQKNISRQEAKELFTQTVNAQEKERDRASARQNAAIAAGAAPADLKIANALVAESKKLGKPITLDEAFKTVKMTPAAAQKGVMTRDQASDNVLKKMETISIASQLQAEATAALKAQGLANPSMSDVLDYLITREMGKDVAAPTIGAPPAGAVRLKSTN